MSEFESEEMTQEQQERLERAEQAALDMLNRRMREGRWYPRRHMRFAYLVIGAIFALYFVILFIGWIIEQL